MKICQQEIAQTVRGKGLAPWNGGSFDPSNPATNAPTYTITPAYNPSAVPPNWVPVYTPPGYPTVDGMGDWGNVWYWDTGSSCSW